MNAYLAEIDRKLREIGAPAARRTTILTEQEQLLRELDDGAANLTDELGTPADYADQVAEQAGSRSVLRRYLGNPLRGLTKGGRASMWNMDDPRVLQPHLLGYGWSVNWAAVAVKLGLVRPDDIDGDVISEIPQSAMQLAVLLPSALTVAHGALLVTSWKRLPSRVHKKWKLNGRPIPKKSTKSALLIPLAGSTVGAGITTLAAMCTDDREDILRVASLSTLLSVISPARLLIVLSEVNGRPNPATTQTGVTAASIVASASCIIFPLRAGLKATWNKSGVA